MTNVRGVFTTAALSPVPVQPQLGDLPYGLVWSDLADMLPGFAGTDGARSWVSHRKQGLNGGATSCIVTLEYPAADGQRRRLTVFFKQAVDPVKAEAARYGFLERQGVALPRLLGSVIKEAGEVIVLEFLPTIGARPQDVDELIDVIARLNTVRNAPTDLFAPPVGMPEDEFDAGVATALAQLVAVPSIGDRVDAAREFAAYKSAEEVVGRMPVGLCHGELAFQQVGRTSAGRMVVFDLETVALRPRLTDIAGILSGLAVLTGLEQESNFGRYCEEVRRLVGTTPEQERTWPELLAVRVVSSFQALPWLMTTIGTEDAGFDPDLFVRDLRADVVELGF